MNFYLMFLWLCPHNSSIFLQLWFMTFPIVSTIKGPPGISIKVKRHKIGFKLHLKYGKRILLSAIPQKFGHLYETKLK